MPSSSENSITSSPDVLHGLKEAEEDDLAIWDRGGKHHAERAEIRRMQQNATNRGYDERRCHYNDVDIDIGINVCGKAASANVDNYTHGTSSSPLSSNVTDGVVDMSLNISSGAESASALEAQIREYNRLHQAYMQRSHPQTDQAQATSSPVPGTAWQTVSVPTCANDDMTRPFSSPDPDATVDRKRLSSSNAATSDCQGGIVPSSQDRTNETASHSKGTSNSAQAASSNNAFGVTQSADRSLYTDAAQVSNDGTLHQAGLGKLATASSNIKRSGGEPEGMKYPPNQYPLLATPNQIVDDAELRESRSRRFPASMYEAQAREYERLHQAHIQRLQFQGNRASSTVPVAINPMYTVGDEIRNPGNNSRSQVTSLNNDIGGLAQSTNSIRPSVAHDSLVSRSGSLDWTGVGKLPPIGVAIGSNSSGNRQGGMKSPPDPRYALAFPNRHEHYTKPVTCSICQCSLYTTLSATTYYCQVCGEETYIGESASARGGE